MKIRLLDNKFIILGVKNDEQNIYMLTHSFFNLEKHASREIVGEYRYEDREVSLIS